MRMISPTAHSRRGFAMFAKRERESYTVAPTHDAAAVSVSFQAEGFVGLKEHPTLAAKCQLTVHTVGRMSWSHSFESASGGMVWG